MMGYYDVQWLLHTQTNTQWIRHGDAVKDHCSLNVTCHLNSSVFIIYSETEIIPSTESVAVQSWQVICIDSEQNVNNILPTGCLFSGHSQIANPGCQSTILHKLDLKFCCWNTWFCYWEHHGLGLAENILGAGQQPVFHEQLTQQF